MKARNDRSRCGPGTMVLTASAGTGHRSGCAPSPMDTNPAGSSQSLRVAMVMTASVIVCSYRWCGRSAGWRGVRRPKWVVRGSPWSSPFCSVAPEHSARLGNEASISAPTVQIGPHKNASLISSKSDQKNFYLSYNHPSILSTHTHTRGIGVL